MQNLTKFRIVHTGSDWPGGLPGDSRWAGRLVGRWAGGPVGRLAGDQQKDYDILFLLAIDVMNHDKNRIVYQGL